MDRCENCVYGIKILTPDPQIRGDSSKRYLDNWECNHPDKKIRRLAQQKGWSEACQEFRQK